MKLETILTFLDVALTLLGVGLATLGIILAVLAFFGYQFLKQATIETAKKTAEKEARQAISEMKELKNITEYSAHKPQEEPYLREEEHHDV